MKVTKIHVQSLLRTGGGVTNLVLVSKCLFFAVHLLFCVCFSLIGPCHHM